MTPKIISHSINDATAVGYSTAVKVTEKLIASGAINASQLHTANQKSSCCTPDQPCGVPNCKSCSKIVYQQQSTHTDKLAIREACKDIPVYAITVFSDTWSSAAPYNVDEFVSQAEYLLLNLKLIPSIKWTAQYDIAIRDGQLKPHIHGTVTGNVNVSELLMSCAAFADIKSPSIDVSLMSQLGSEKPISINNVTAWSKYQHKMQCLNTDSCRSAGEFEYIRSLRVLSNVLFCDTQHTYSSRSNCPASFPYKLVGEVTKITHRMASLGLTKLASRLSLLTVNTTAKNSTVFAALADIEFDENELSKLRTAINRHIKTEHNDPATKKLLLFFLTQAAVQTKNKRVLTKLQGYWPTPASSQNQRHYLAQWLDLLLA